MDEWLTLMQTSQVKKNDAVRTALAVNNGKRWIYIVENVEPDKIYLSGGENYPEVKIIYGDELVRGEYEFVSLRHLPM